MEWIHAYGDHSVSWCCFGAEFSKLRRVEKTINYFKHSNLGEQLLHLFKGFENQPATFRVWLTIRIEHRVISTRCTHERNIRRCRYCIKLFGLHDVIDVPPLRHVRVSSFERRRC